VILLGKITGWFAYPGWLGLSIAGCFLYYGWIAVIAFSIICMVVVLKAQELRSD
jgi:hypothetical protein